jgi:polyhydroxybutyrate depolymerase
MRKMRLWPSFVVAGLCSCVALFTACGGSDSGGSAGSSGSSGQVDPDGGESSSGETPPGDPTPGCGTAVSKTGALGSQSITVGGVKRTYELFLPDTYDSKTSLALVLAFHGDGGSGKNIRLGFGTGIEQAAAGAAVFAYPDGRNETWQLDDPAGLAADVAFVDAIVAELEAKYCVDAKRVFLTGFSSGAYFVNQAACRTKSALRGIVTCSGGGPFGVQDSEFDGNGDLVCPAPPVAALQIQGAADGTVSPDEGHKARDYWRGANACSTATSPYDPSPCVSYGDCERPEVYCEIPGMGHQIWSEAAKTAWSFFASL